MGQEVIEKWLQKHTIAKFRDFLNQQHMNKRVKCKHLTKPTTQKMTHIIKLKNQNVPNYQLTYEHVINFHFSLTEQDNLKLYYFITCYCQLKTACEDSNITLKGVIILKALQFNNTAKYVSYQKQSTYCIFHINAQMCSRFSLILMFIHFLHVIVQATQSSVCFETVFAHF